MPLGRPRAPGTDAERAEARRAKVRVIVQAFRRRQKEKRLAEVATRANQEADGSAGSTYLDVSYDNSSVSAASTRSARSSPGALFQVPDSDYADPDSWIWHLSRDLISNAAYQDAFVSGLQTEYFPPPEPREMCPYESHKHFSNVHFTWFKSVSTALGPAGSQIMSDAFLAAALTIISRERQDADMGVHAAFIQSRALRKLRIALQKFADGEECWYPIALSLCALTCAMAELLANRSWDNFASHLGGVGSLVQYDGPENLTLPAARDHFYGYRALQAPFALMYGRDTFLSEPEWIDVPWKHEVELAKHPLHTMLDIAYRIVPEISAQNSSRIWSTEDLRNRLHRLDMIAVDMSEWERKFRLDQPNGLHQRKEAQWPGLYDYAFEFNSLSSAIAYAMYCGARVKLADIIIRVMTTILAQDAVAEIQSRDVLFEGVKWSRQGLQSLEYFQTGTPKAVGRIPLLFPFECSWAYLSRVELDAHCDVRREREWCFGTAQRLTTMDTPVFAWR